MIKQATYNRLNAQRNMSIHLEKHTAMFISPKGASDIFWQQLFKAKK
jgi:hypothetical protein